MAAAPTAAVSSSAVSAVTAAAVTAAVSAAINALPERLPIAAATDLYPATESLGQHAALRCPSPPHYCSATAAAVTTATVTAAATTTATTFPPHFGNAGLIRLKQHKVI